MTRSPTNFLSNTASVFLGLQLCFLLTVSASAQVQRAGDAAIPNSVILRILKSEDERDWPADLNVLLKEGTPTVRRRVALAAGRIGDERAVPGLISALTNDKDDRVREMAAFALGETESANAVDALVSTMVTRGSPLVRARVVEALGKIAATLPQTDEARLKAARAAIFSALEFEARRRSGPDSEVILAGLTAALRARPENVGRLVAEFLTYSDNRVRADAANTLARLRAKDGNDELRKLLTSDPDAVVRANAARVLGATEDREAFHALVDRAKNDQDLRVRVSAIRALGALKDQRAATTLVAHVRGERTYQSSEHLTLDGVNRSDLSAAEVLEIATVLGRLLPNTDNSDAIWWANTQRNIFKQSATELEIAVVRISPGSYLHALGDPPDARSKARNLIGQNWRQAGSLAQALGEVAALPESTKNRQELSATAESILRAMLDSSGSTATEKGFNRAPYAIPDVLRALAAFKPADLSAILRKHLSQSDVVVRGTAADLLGELPADEANTRALVAALTKALAEKDSNDAALSILDALAKQKSGTANEALKSALKSPDHLVRRRAVSLLKSNGAGDLSSQIGTVQTRNTNADYLRAIARLGKTVQATVDTTKGTFTIEFLPEDAPMTVDNFVQLAQRGYFRNITFHRVVPNFVIQGGDPRGDGSGGPGYQIRCEINEVEFDRGVVGMALSGKDTGGSQWFVTHSPQPHLDGGYTVFGKVVSGMEVVDAIVRGDVIRSVVVSERPRGVKRAKQ